MCDPVPNGRPFKGCFGSTSTVAERMRKIYHELDIVKDEPHISSQNDPDVRPILKHVPSLDLWLCGDRHGIEVYTYSRDLQISYNMWVRQWNNICRVSRPNLMIGEPQ